VFWIMLTCNGKICIGMVVFDMTLRKVFLTRIILENSLCQLSLKKTGFCFLG